LKGLEIYKDYVSGHCPLSCFYPKHRSVYISKHNVSETGFCLRLHVRPTQLGPFDTASPYLRTRNGYKKLIIKSKRGYHLNDLDVEGEIVLITRTSKRLSFLDMDRIDHVQG
jgi:hypothetical protein